MKLARYEVHSLHSDGEVVEISEKRLTANFGVGFIISADNGKV